MSSINQMASFDSPAERQIILLKLIHEFENAPDFGDEYISDASSDTQQWISRIGALLSRVALEYKLGFRTAHKLSFGDWKKSRETFRQIMSAAIEEIKLELEIDGQEDIGKVYEAGKEYDLFTDLKGIIKGAENDIFVIDAYFDTEAFQAYLSTANNDLHIRILCGKYAPDLAACTKTFSAQTGAKVEVRKTKKIHDRVIFIDESDCWIVGASIKDAGKKPTFLIPLAPQLTPEKLAIYEGIWSQEEVV